MFNVRKKQLLCTSASMVLLTLQTSTTFAQAASEDAFILEEVTVTARKTSENIQEVPLAVSAFDSDAIADRGIKTLFDLNMIAPGVNMGTTGNRGGTGRLMMRGLTAGTSGQAKASVFMDGVYLSGDVTNIPTEMMERIEVMPGPQSALFGRSTFAGALSYVTKDPTPTLESSMVFDSATDDERRYSVLVRGPLVEGLSGLINMYSFEYGGPKEWKNPIDGVQLGSIKSQGSFVKLKYEPFENLTLKLSGHWSRDRDAMGEVFTLDPRQRNGAIPKIDSANTAVFGTTAFYPIGTVPSLTAAPNGGQNPAVTPLAGRTASGYRLHFNVDYSLADYLFAASYAVNSEHNHQENDVDATYYNSQTVLFDGRPRDRQLELRITSPQEQRLRWSVGYFYMVGRDITGLQGVGTVYSYPGCTAAPCIFPNVGSLTPVGSFAVNSAGRITDSAPFAGVFVDITPQLTTGLEVRYQREKVFQQDYTQAASALNPAQATFTATLPRFTADYKWTPDVHSYFVFSKGNNPGGFNLNARLFQPDNGGADPSLFTIKEEKLNNYEVGLKSLWLDKRLRVNVALYKMDWTDQQIPASFVTGPGNPLPGTIYSLTLNKGSSEIKGATLEVEALPAAGLNVRMTASFNDAKYKNFCSTNYGALLGIASVASRATNPVTLVNPITGKSFVVGATPCVPVDGNTLDGQSPFTGSLGAGYTHALNDEWTWNANGDLQHSTGMWDSEMNLARAENATVSNLSIGIKNKNYGFTAYCRNCGNEDSPYRITRFSDARAGTSNQYNQNITQLPRRPRQFGLRIDVSL